MNMKKVKTKLKRKEKTTKKQEKKKITKNAKKKVTVGENERKRDQAPREKNQKRTMKQNLIKLFVSFYPMGVITKSTHSEDSTKEKMMGTKLVSAQ